MNPATTPTLPVTRPEDPAVAPLQGGVHDAAAVPGDVIDNLVVRVAGADEREAILELARRSGTDRAPTGALMVGALEDRLLAAVSISTGEVVNEPTSSGEAAAAVVRYRVSRLGRRGAAAA
jgi:hypothetical protein